MNPLSMRRFGALTAAALVATAVTAVAAPAQAAVTYDLSALQAEQAWLASRTSSGLVQSQAGASHDYSQTSDAVVQMHLIGDNTTAKAMADALYPHISDYATSATGIVALGKIVTAVELGDPSLDVSTQLQTIVNAVGSNGQVSDASTYGTSNWSQLYTVDALALAVKNGNTDAVVKSALSSAAHYLAGQQCDIGGFAYSFDAGSQDDGHLTCDPATFANPDPTTTGLVTQALLNADAANVTGLDRTIGRGETFLLAIENPDGGWGYDGSGSDPENTGVAGETLALLGHSTIASVAASYISSLQLKNVGTCTPYAPADLGAVAYDAATRGAAQKTPISSTTVEGFEYQATQAMAVLQYLPSVAATPTLVGPTGYIQGGKSVSYTVKGLAPGSHACLTVGTSKSLINASVDGTATGSVIVPTTTSTPTVTVTDGTATAHTTVKVLGAKVFTVSPSTFRPRRGTTFTLRVSGMAKGERVTVVYAGRVVLRSYASSTGTYSHLIAAGTALGNKAVLVTGQFSNRKGSKTITVVR